MSQTKLSPSEIQLLREAIRSDYKTCNIRLREGEYQYDLAKTIASFHLELCFPDVKDITKRLYLEEKTNDIQFIRKIQTILKKMEKSGIIKILPKKQPWELQRYALTSFKFQDTDKNLITLATEQQISQMQSSLNSINMQETLPMKPSYIKIKISILTIMLTTSYLVILWDLMQPTINPIISIPAFCIAVFLSLLLGKTLSQK
ncbi:MAG: hypothetical protein QXE76_01105 [Candidatus Bathyarchaeia archaeon]